MATDTDAGERAAMRAAGGDVPASDPRGDGWSSFWITDHDPEFATPPPADDGISRLAVAEAVQVVPARPETIWNRGDLVSFDNGRTRLARVRLVGPCSRRPGVWTTDLVGVDLHEVYFRRAD